jgi:hypothetical protein
MKKKAIIVFLVLIALVAEAQIVHDAKFGLGASFLGTGDMLIGKVEGEATRKWNRIVSNSVAVGIGYGDSEIYNSTFPQRTFTVHLDANVFVSPFGNRGVYNFKLGTGPSLMYVLDTCRRRESSIREDRLSLGFSMMVENEVAISDNQMVGLKMMVQPYLNGDIASTLLLKFGKRLHR